MLTAVGACKNNHCSAPSNVKHASGKIFHETIANRRFVVLDRFWVARYHAPLWSLQFVIDLLK